MNGRKRNVNVSVNGRNRNVNITENDKRLKVMLCNERLRGHEIELARIRVEDNVLNRPGQTERNIGSMGSVPKLPSFDEKMDDLDAYLYRFEGYATMQGWPKGRWASNMSALLKGNGLQGFHRMLLDDSGDYELLKIALLNRYRLTDADFRNKFRQAKPQDCQSFSQFGIRITGYLDRWIELSETSLFYEGIRDLLIREQTLEWDLQNYECSLRRELRDHSRKCVILQSNT